MKTLFEFEELKKVETEETIISQEEGKEVKTIKIVEKEISVKIAIKKPTRELIDEGKLFYAVETSKAHQRGIISEVLLRKRLTNDGGTLSEREKEEFGTLYLSFYELQSEYFLLDNRNFDELSDNEKERKKELKIKLGELTQKINAFEQANSQIFENTVEALARNASMRWWILQTAYMQKIDDKGNVKDEYVPIFGAGDFNSKLKNYDDLEEKSEEFYIKAIKKLAFLCSNWYVNQANTREEFQKLADNYDKELANDSKSQD